MLGPLLKFLKTIKIGGREKAREKKVEWEQQCDRAGENLLND